METIPPESRHGAATPQFVSPSTPLEFRRSAHERGLRSQGGHSPHSFRRQAQGGKEAGEEDCEGELSQMQTLVWRGVLIFFIGL